MGQVPVDLYLEVTYPIDDPAALTIESNIKPELQADILATFIQTQVGKGKDDSPAEEHDVYKIKIGLILADDTFLCEHNTGNLGLRDGILMDVLKHLGARENTNAETDR